MYVRVCLHMCMLSFVSNVFRILTVKGRHSHYLTQFLFLRVFPKLQCFLVRTMKPNCPW